MSQRSGGSPHVPMRCFNEGGEKAHGITQHNARQQIKRPSSASAGVESPRCISTPLAITKPTTTTVSLHNSERSTLSTSPSPSPSNSHPHSKILIAPVTNDTIKVSPSAKRPSNLHISESLLEIETSPSLRPTSSPSESVFSSYTAYSSFSSNSSYSISPSCSPTPFDEDANSLSQLYAGDAGGMISDPLSFLASRRSRVRSENPSDLPFPTSSSLATSTTAFSSSAPPTTADLPSESLLSKFPPIILNLSYPSPEGAGLLLSPSSLSPHRSEEKQKYSVIRSNTAALSTPKLVSSLLTSRFTISQSLPSELNKKRETSNGKTKSSSETKVVPPWSISHHVIQTKYFLPIVIIVRPSTFLDIDLPKQGYNFSPN